MPRNSVPFPASAARALAGRQVTPSAEARTSGCVPALPETAPTAIQPAWPYAAAARLARPATAPRVAADSSVQVPLAARRQIAGWPSAAPTAKAVPPTSWIEATVTAPRWPGYPARVAPAKAGGTAFPDGGRLALAAGAAGDATPASDRGASISLALPVSISSAPAPTVTMMTAGTPIVATCTARRRRDGLPGRDAGHDRRGAAASLTDPCQARNSSSGSLSGEASPERGGSARPANPSAPTAPAVGAPTMTGALSGTCPLPTGQDWSVKPLAGYSFQPGPRRRSRPAWSESNRIRSSCGGACPGDGRGWFGRAGAERGGRCKSSSSRTDPGRPRSRRGNRELPAGVNVGCWGTAAAGNSGSGGMTPESAKEGRVSSTTVGLSPMDRLAASLGSAGPGPSNQVPADSARAGSWSSRPGSTGSGSESAASALSSQAAADGVTAGSGSEGSGSARSASSSQVRADSGAAGARAANAGSARSGPIGSASSNHRRSESIAAGRRRAGAVSAKPGPRNPAPGGSASPRSQVTPESCHTCWASCQPERCRESSSPATALGGTAIPGPPARPRNASVGPTTGMRRDRF